jgi:hypothetical protein
MEARKNVHRIVERLARESYGRLLAYLCVQMQALAGAEDALSQSLLKALTGRETAYLRIPKLGCSRQPATRSSISSVISE